MSSEGLNKLLSSVEEDKRGRKVRIDAQFVGFTCNFVSSMIYNCCGNNVRGFLSESELSKKEIRDTESVKAW